jgi:hypothetical protein
MANTINAVLDRIETQQRDLDRVEGETALELLGGLSRSAAAAAGANSLRGGGIAV